MIVEFLLGAVSLLLLWAFLTNKNGKNQPPGPVNIPFFGNLLQIIKIHPVLSHVALHQLSLKYGPIMSIKMGWRDTIVLCGFNEMKDLLVKAETSGRVYDSYLLDRSNGKEEGVIFVNGELWTKIRRVTVRALREFGLGKAQSMESIIEQEALNLVEHTKKEVAKNNGIVRIDERYFHMGVLNAIWAMLAGTRYEWDDPKLQELLDINDRAFDVGSFGANLSFSFPALRYVFTETFAYHLQKKLYKELREYFRDQYRERKRCKEYLTDPRCAFDIFLQESEKENGKADAIFFEDQIAMIALDLFQAGGETTAANLGYCMMMMIYHPKVQSRIHEEIDSVCPKGTIPCLSHQNQMPYTQAFLLEVMRLCHIVPLVPPRKFVEDCEYKGYHFKKGTAILVNIYSASMDKAYWKDPEEFRPERFIGKDGQYVPDEHVASFGFGKRMCLGDTLAKSSIFIMFISMMQNYTLERVKGEELPTMEPICGFTMRPQHFNVQFKERN